MTFDGDARSTTDWSQWSVEHMWQVLQAEDPDRTARHSDAWYEVMYACAQHRDRLRNYRDKLSQRWSGLAADVYVARLDLLIAGLDETTNAAFNTYRALNTLADAVTIARKDMAPLYARYQRLATQEQDYQNQWWVMQVVGGNPVSDEDREAVNRPARDIMRTAADAIFHSYHQMTPAPSMDGWTSYGDEWQPGPPSEPGSVLQPPRLAPLGAQRPGPMDGVPPTTGDPVLSGSQTSLPPPGFPPVVPAPNAVPPPAPPVIGTPVMLPGPSPIGELPGQSPRQSSAGGTAAPPGRSGVTNSGVGSPAVIGARPGASGWAPTMPMGMPQAGRRINPVGGVLGEPGYTAGGRSRRIHSSYYPDEERFAIDTSAAVRPVIEPDPEPTFDPGPAIGLPR